MITDADGTNNTDGGFAALWAKLTPIQRRFAVAMLEHPSKKEAAAAVGISPSTTYNWNSDVNDAIDYMTDNMALSVLGILAAAATKAAMVKANGLDSLDERVRQSVATEIIERHIGKVANPISLSVNDLRNLSDDELQRIVES
jgi:hypothetical protein